MSRIGTASRLSAMPAHRVNTSKSIGIAQLVSKKNLIVILQK